MSKPNGDTAAKRPKKKTKKAGPRGFTRHKTQISIRIEDSVLALAQSLAKHWGEGITDVVEAALLEAAARRLKEPPETRLARFLVLRANPEEQRDVVRLLGYMRLPDTIFSTVDIFRKHWKGVLAEVEKFPEFAEAIRSYGEMPELIKSEVADARDFFVPLIEGQRRVHLTPEVVLDSPKEPPIQETPGGNAP